MLFGYRKRANKPHLAAAAKTSVKQEEEEGGAEAFRRCRRRLSLCHSPFGPSWDARPPRAAAKEEALSSSMWSVAAAATGRCTWRKEEEEEANEAWMKGGRERARGRAKSYLRPVEIRSSRVVVVAAVRG